jgi:XTP/dITP diphosphohydrolase
MEFLKTRTKIYISSGNKDKAAEILRVMQTVFPETEGRIIIRAAFEAEETGTTYKENAYIKAWALHRELILEGSENHFVLGDDSGMEVLGLNNEPGVFSARYAEKECLLKKVPLSFGENIKKVLKKLESAPQSPKSRNAEMICHLCLIHFDIRVKKGKVNVYHSEGRVAGRITDTLGGDHGFGYDPIFYYEPKGRTFAQISDTEKDKISHRFKAFQEIKNQFSSFSES